MGDESGRACRRVLTGRGNLARADGGSRYSAAAFGLNPTAASDSIVASNSPAAPNPIAASNSTAASDSMVASNSTAAPNPIAASNSTAASNPIAASNPVAASNSTEVSASPASGLAVESWTLDDGTTVALVEDHRAPVVSLRIVFPVGTWSPWVRRSHAEEAFEFQLRDPKAALRERARALAADLDLGMGPRTAGLRASFLREDLDAVAELIRDVFANRDYDRRELIAKRRADTFSWGLSARDPEFRLGQAAARRLFEPGDPRLLRWERPEPVERDAAKLAAARDVLVRLPGRVVGFAGAISRADAERVARTLLPAAAPDVPADLAPRLGSMRAQAGADEELRLARLTQVYFAWVAFPSRTDPRRSGVPDRGSRPGRALLFPALRRVAPRGRGDRTGRDAQRRRRRACVVRARTFTKTDNARADRSEAARRDSRVPRQGDDRGGARGRGGYLAGTARSRGSPRPDPGRPGGTPPGSGSRVLRRPGARAAALSLDEVNAFVRGLYDPAGFTMLRAVPE